MSLTLIGLTTNHVHPTKAKRASYTDHAAHNGKPFWIFHFFTALAAADAARTS